MIAEQDILDAIAEVEQQPDTFIKAAKLATFYSLLDHLYPPGYSGENNNNEETFYGDSEFLTAIRGKDSAFLWGIMDELMNTVAILMPRLYDGVMRKLEGR